MDCTRADQPCKGTTAGRPPLLIASVVTDLLDCFFRRPPFLRAATACIPCDFCRRVVHLRCKAKISLGAEFVWAGWS